MWLHFLLLISSSASILAENVWSYLLHRLTVTGVAISLVLKLIIWGFLTQFFKGFPNCSAGKESACNAGDTRDMGSIFWWGRSPGEGNGNPLQYSFLKNPMDRRSWWAKGQKVAKRRHDWVTKHARMHSVPSDVFLSPLFPQCIWLQKEVHI